MKKTACFIAIALLLCLSCKKEAEPVIPQNNFIKEAFDYVQLSTNDYFIYRDSATGDTDSVIVTNSELERILSPKRESTQLFDPGQPAYYYQTFTLLLSKVNGTGTEDWLYAIASSASFSYAGSGATESADLKLLERNRSRNEDRLYIFNYPLTQAFTFTQVSPLSLTIEGTNYPEVIRFSGNNGLTPSSPNYQQYYQASAYYWVKGIGIIKRELITATSVRSWTLVKKGKR